MNRKIKLIKYYQDIILFSVLIFIKAILFRTLILSPLFIKGVFADFIMMIVLVSLITLVTSRKVRPYILFSVNFIVSLIWFSAATYFNYYGSVPTYLTLTSLGQVGQIGESITASIQPIYFMFALDLIMIVIFFIINLFRKSKQNAVAVRMEEPSRRRIVLFSAIVLFIGLIISAGLLRQTKSITNELELARHLGMYHYQIAYAMHSEARILGKDTIDEEERAKLIANIRSMLEKDSQEQQAYAGVAKDNHLISIQLEAFQNFLIGLKVDGQEITPFLNEFIKTNFYFSNVYQQIGEGNTSDAEFLANTGAYPIGSIAMSKTVGNKEVPSLPRILKQEGYHAYTFHINDVTFWKRNEMYPALGFDKYYERSSFINDNFNGFGASDRELYRVAIDEIVNKDAQGEKIYAHLIATSGHHPFVIPEEFRLLQLPDTLEGTQLGHYLQAAHYVDGELKTFFEKLEQHGLREKTTVVLYGDHFGLQPKDNDPAWVTEQLGIPYHDTLSRFNIPLIVSVPNVSGEQIDLTGGQIDIVPTVLNLLGVSTKETDLLLFGQDLLNSTTNTFGVRYYLPTGSFFNDTVMYIPGDSFETGHAINLKTFEPVEDITPLKEDYEYILKLMKESDRYTSQYRTIENSKGEEQSNDEY